VFFYLLGEQRWFVFFFFWGLGDLWFFFSVLLLFGGWPFVLWGLLGGLWVARWFWWIIRCCAGGALVVRFCVFCLAPRGVGIFFCRVYNCFVFFCFVFFVFFAFAFVFGFLGKSGFWGLASFFWGWCVAWCLVGEVLGQRGGGFFFWIRVGVFFFFVFTRSVPFRSVLWFRIGLYKCRGFFI